MAETSRSTTDHDEIRQWAQQRGGVPATVSETDGQGDAGVLRIKFPGYGDDERLEEISWQEWLSKFEDNRLAFLYQDTTSDGETSTFNKLVSRE